MGSGHAGLRALALTTTGALLAQGLVLGVAAPPAVAAPGDPIDTSAGALALARALSAEPGVVTGAAFVSRSDGSPTAVVSKPLAGFPREGGDYALLTSGDAALADDPNSSGGAGSSNGGGVSRGSTAFDVTILRVDVQVPADVNCLLGFDFRFLSEEFPEFVGSGFNDAFIAELDRTTWTTSGSAISAPDNFAFDPSGSVISINSSGVTSMSAAEAVGTTYDGATPLLSAATPITPGPHALYFSIFDQGDSVLDSAVMLDALRFGRVADVARDCRPGAQQAVAGIPLGQTFGRPGGTSPGSLPGYRPPGYARNPSGEGGDPVNTATGAYGTAVVDLALPGALPLVLGRSYTSLDDRVGALGRGWTHTYEAALQVEQDGDVVALAPNGQRVTYARAADGSYAGPRGSAADLSATATGFRLEDESGSAWLFDGDGRLREQRDRHGNGVALTWEDDLPVRVTDSAGRSVALQHDAEGRLRSATLSDGRSVSYGYTAGLLTSVVDAAGGTTRYEYDDQGRLTRLVDQVGAAVVTNAYDDQGRVVEQVDAVGGVTRLQYRDGATEVVDPRGAVTTDEYSEGRLVRRTDPAGGVLALEYDDDLRVVALTDARGARLGLEFDPAGRVVAAGSPGAPGLAVERDEQGDPVAVTDARGTTRRAAYDHAGGLLRLEDPDGVALFTRDARGALTSATDPRGHTTAFGYDQEGDLVSTRTPTGRTTRYEHDAAGRVTAVVEESAGGATTRVEHDAADRVVRVVDPLGQATTVEYDAAGNRTAETDARGATTRFGYDAARRLTSVTAADGSVTRYAYDPAGNLTRRTDANGATTSYEHDLAGRLVRLTAPGGGVWTYAYDAVGDLVSITDANGNSTPQEGDGTTRYRYDPAGRVVAVDHSDSTPDVELQYDVRGDLVEVRDGAGTQQRTYDASGRLLTVTRGGAVTRYAYGPGGELVETTAPDGTVTRVSHDPDGRVEAVTTPAGTTSYRYDAAGQLAERVLPSSTGVVESNRYDAAGRLVGRTSAAGAVVHAQVEAVLDPLGNPLQLSSRSTSQAMQYDARGRLSAWCPDRACTEGERYVHDAVGNRVEVTRGKDVVRTTYDAGDRPTGSAAPAFDANGNQTTIGGRPATYDLANRLVRLGPLPGARTCAPRCDGPDPAATVEIAYDAEGNRTAKTVSAPGGAPVVTTYEHDLNGPLPLLLAERQGGEVVRSYRYAEGEFLGLATPEGELHALRDGLGSTTDLLDDRGRKAWRYTYGADGVTRQEHVNRRTPVNPVQFTGQHYDADLGLYDLRTRLYDPRTARFVQRDTVLLDPWSPAASSYLYADGRPTSVTDPAGTCPFCVLAGVGALVGGVASAATYAVTNRGADFSTRGLLAATVSGAAAGALGAVAGPVVGTATKALTGAAGGVVNVGLSGAANAGIGAGGAYLDNVLAGRDTTASSLLFGAGFGALGGYAGGRFAPGSGMSTIRSAQYFAPRTVRGAFNPRGRNTQALYRSGFIGGGIGLGGALVQGLGSNAK